jgi:hypothetical protein
MKNGGFKLEIELLEGEKVVLEDSVGSWAVMLTDKRLVIQKKKGIFHSFWVIVSDFPLDTIEKAYTEMEPLAGITSLWLDFKDGESAQFPKLIGSAELIGTLGAADIPTDMAVKINAVNNKWVNAINNQLSKHQMEQLSNGMRKCPNCGKQVPQGNFGFCPYCGTSLNI